MMRLPPFRFLAPATLKEAAHLMADSGGSAMPVGGGTDLYPNMKRRQVTPSVVVSLHNIAEMHQVRPSADGIAVGASMTLSRLADHPTIRGKYAPVAQAIKMISTPLLRNMGTLGGNLCLDTRCHFLNQSSFWRQALGSCMKAEGEICVVAPSSPRCWAITSSDLPPLLIAMESTVRLVGFKGERIIDLADLYRDDGIEYLAKAPDEILGEVMLPRLNGMRAGYLKLRRRGTFDFPALGVAAALKVDTDGTCEAARIVLGAVTSQPLVMPEAQTMVGEKISTELIRSVAEAVGRRAKPLQLADYTFYYRKQMVTVYVRRLLEQLIQ